MFDISWTEFLLIGVVALIAIGPKELPGVLRTAGQWMGKVRRMASEFQGQFQEALREAEMADLKKEVDSIRDSASGLASDLNAATRIEDPLTPSTPSTTSEPISGAPPPPLATEAHPTESPAIETHADTATLPASAEQAAPPVADAAASVDVHVPLPESPPPLTEKDFASATPTADAAPIHAPPMHPPKSGEGAA